MVDALHQTSVPGLFAAGECCSQYHGANRLGGNSLLGAIYGGVIAARSAMGMDCAMSGGKARLVEETPVGEKLAAQSAVRRALGPIRDREGLESCIASLERLHGSVPLLARAVAMCALSRKESRGAHFRKDFPNEDEACAKATVARYDGKEVRVRLEGAK
jgi:succinate dehydrogenase / fumarate reductase flavoprotein subunit